MTPDEMTASRESMFPYVYTAASTTVRDNLLKPFHMYQHKPSMYRNTVLDFVAPLWKTCTQQTTSRSTQLLGTVVQFIREEMRRTTHQMIRDPRRYERLLACILCADSIHRQRAIATDLIEKPLLRDCVELQCDYAQESPSTQQMATEVGTVHDSKKSDGTQVVTAPGSISGAWPHHAASSPSKWAPSDVETQLPLYQFEKTSDEFVVWICNHQSRYMLATTFDPDAHVPTMPAVSVPASSSLRTPRQADHTNQRPVVQSVADRKSVV